MLNAGGPEKCYFRGGSRTALSELHFIHDSNVSVLLDFKTTRNKENEERQTEEIG